MKFGFFGAGVGGMVHPDAGQVATFAEELGYHSMWTGEHMVVPNQRPDYLNITDEWAFGDPFVVLSYLAAQTTSIKLCTGMVILPQRHPVQLAKEAATLDILSGGRFVLGVGLGHLQAEFDSLGIDMSTRAARTVEYLQAMRALWRQDEKFEGRFVQFEGVSAHPRPLLPEGPPIVLGGHSPAALRRAARHGAGWYGWGLSPKQTRDAIARIRLEADRLERNLSGFEISLTPLRRLSATDVAQYAEVGVDQLVITVEAPDLDGVRRRLELNAPARFH